jgi:hypothetical protein
MPEIVLTKSQKRLLDLFTSIEDEDIKEIIIEVINVEVTNRSSHNFPIRKVRDAVDNVARLQEAGAKKGG